MSTAPCRIRRASTPNGRVVTQPCSDRHEAWAWRPAAARRPGRGLPRSHSACSSSSSRACTVTYRPSPEQLALPLSGQAAREFGGVVGGGLGLEVGEPAVFHGWPGDRRPPSSRAELPRSRSAATAGGYGLDMQGHVETARIGQQRLEPPSRDLGRIAGNREGRRVVPAEPQRPERPRRRARPGSRVAQSAVPPWYVRRRRVRVSFMAGSPGW